MKTIIAGAGSMGRTWGENLRDHFPEVEVAAWVDLDLAAAERGINDFGFPARAFTDVGAAIEASGAEMLVNVTIPDAHAPISIAAFEAGLDVICEKPLASSLDEARAMVNAAERNGRTFMVSQNRRFDRNLAAMRNLVAETIGEDGVLTADYFMGCRFGGFRDALPHVLLIEMAIHTFDSARAISGRDAKSVYAEEFNPSWSWFKGDSGATCLFEMEGGGRFEYRGLWSGDGAPTSWNSSWRAVGPNGTALFDGDSPPSAEAVVKRGDFWAKTETIRPEPPETRGGIEGTFAEFLAARRENREPISSGRSNFNSLAMVFGAIESARAGRRIEIERL